MSQLLQPVCANCACTMRCAKNDFDVATMSFGEPYELHRGDKWRCKGCKAEIVIGFGRPMKREHPAFKQSLALNTPLKIDDE